MSKIWYNFKINRFKKNILKLNKEKNIFNDIEFKDMDKDCSISIDTYNSFKKEITLFFNQLEPIKKSLNVKLVIKLSKKADNFWFSPQNNTMIVSVNNLHNNIKEVFNHEFLHLLDYYNSINKSSFSEDYENISKKIKRKKKIHSLQSDIIRGKESDNLSIKKFDFILLKLIMRVFMDRNVKEKVTDKHIEMLSISNLNSFNRFLDAINILKGQYYLRNNIFITSDYLKDKNMVYPDLKRYYQDVDNFEKRFKYICRKNNISGKELDKHFIQESSVIAMSQKFSCFINSGLDTFQNIFDYYKNVDVHQIRNLYYTPTLKILTNRVNPLLIESMVNSRLRKIDNVYLFNASEKLSYCGQKNIGNIINEYLKLTFNNKYDFKFTEQFFPTEFDDLSDSSKEFFENIQKITNKSIFFDPNLNIKNNVMKKQSNVNTPPKDITVFPKIQHVDKLKELEIKEKIIEEIKKKRTIKPL